MGIKHPKQKNAQFLLYCFLSLLVSSSVFVYLFNRITLVEITSAVMKVPLWFLVMFVVYSLSMSICRAWRYQILLKVTNEPPGYLSLFLVTLVRNLFSDLLPARVGSVVYIYLVNKRLNVPLYSATSSFAICLLFDVIAVFFIGLFLSFTYYSRTGITALLFSIALVSFLSTYLMLISLPWLLFQLKKIAGKMYLDCNAKERFMNWIVDLSNEIDTVKQSGVYTKVFVLSLIIRILKYLALYSLFIGLIIGLDENIAMFPVYKVFSGIMAAEFSASLPISGIAGFGAYEGTWTYVFQLLGYPEKLAAVTSVSHHLITQIYGYGLGALSVLVLLLPWWKKAKRKKDLHEMTGKYDDRFGLKFMMLLTVVTLLILLLPIKINMLGRDHQVKLLSSSNISSVHELKENQLKIKGKLIYQRSDGIYVQKISNQRELKIIEGGTYPRWSNDGKRIVFLQGKKVMVANHDGKGIQLITVLDKPQAVGFHPDGIHVLFIDGKKIMMADIRKKNVEKIWEGYRFKEFDISGDGKKIVATVKGFSGYTILLYNLNTKTIRSVAEGCSASISPDGERVTVNTSGHKTLEIYEIKSLRIAARIHAPHDDLFDNQKWSNHNDWIVATSEIKGKNIFIHRVSSDIAYQMTKSGDSDRADLFLEY